MKFNDYPYQRPDLDLLKSRFDELLPRLSTAPTVERALIRLEELDALRRDFDTMYNLCYIRHSSNTKDEFYEAENNWFDRNLPDFEGLNNRFYRALNDHPLKNELIERLGKQLFAIARMKLEVFSPEIVDELREENQLRSAYMKIKAVANFEVDGESYNLSSIIRVLSDHDPAKRKRALEAQWQFFAKHRDEIEGIYDQLVKIRHRIAQKLGFKNFVELGYRRMLRSDYDADLVRNFRQQILEGVVPLATQLYERQKKRLGLDRLEFWHEDFRFPSGNARPQGSPEWIVERAERMYRELSPETHEFFQFMRQRELMDLVGRDGKATGGYCTLIPDFGSPFIFSNFNGTSGDIDVLTHEAGHAFQVFESRALRPSDYQWPTYEACEIHSMSMELFTYPWMELFFEHDTEKYKFSHLAGAIRFLPYGVAIDEFQHYVYENPEVTIEERRAAWKRIEDRYQPHRDYGDLEILNEGCFWMRQTHLFASPFYYIDYTLAQVCAFQFWQRDRIDHESAWSDYLQLCRAGGSKSFLTLVELAGLKSPFAPGTIAEAVTPVEAYLNSVNDAQW